MTPLGYRHLGLSGTFLSSETQLPWNPPVRVSNHIKNDIFDTEIHLESIQVAPNVTSTRVHWKAQYFQSIFSFGFNSIEFPFDTQQLYWKVADLGVLASETGGKTVCNFSLSSDKEESQLLAYSSDFQIQGFEIRNANLDIKNGLSDGKILFSEYIVTVDAHRIWGPFLIRQIFPGVIMTLVSWTGIWFDQGILLPRVLPTLFGLLSQINLLGSANRFLPPANKITWFESFALVNVILSFMPLVELTVTAMLTKEVAKKVDKMSRVLFPTLMITCYTFILVLHLGSRIGGIILFLISLLLIFIVASIHTYRNIITQTPSKK